jgi:hypothetical protein
MRVPIQVTKGEALLPFDVTQRGHNVPSTRIYVSHYCFYVGFNGSNPSASWNELWHRVEVVYDNARRPEQATPSGRGMSDHDTERQTPLTDIFEHTLASLEQGHTALLYGLRHGDAFRVLPADPLLPVPVSDGDWELLAVIER